jgi:radical SAM protein with 4Fe4S-binding SPASM domain
LCVLGGFGDPLRHPDFAGILEILRPSSSGGVFGLCVRTSAVDLTEDVAEAIVSHGVDVLVVTLDAWTPELYAKLQGVDHPDSGELERVRSRMDRLSELQRGRSSPRPIIVPEFVKARENVHELDAFFDGWTRRVGAVSIVGFSHYAGQLEDRSVIDMRPPVRTACRRVRSRCLVLADGRVALCDQDFRGTHAVGRIGDSTLSEIWRSAEFERVRSAHVAGRFGERPICATCAEWHRP